jgi:ATP-dependent DNA ligase
MRKTNLERLLRTASSSPLEICAIGPDLFTAACAIGREGLVSKRSDSKYGAGRSPNWIKVKNRTHPSIGRVMESRR